MTLSIRQTAEDNFRTILRFFGLTFSFLVITQAAHSQSTGTEASRGTSLSGAAHKTESSVNLDETGHAITFEPSQKNIIGTQHYFSNDTSLRVDLPMGYTVNGAYSFYKSDTSTRTATMYIGAGKDWDQGFVSATYSWTPLTNNYRSHAFEVQGAYITDATHYRTTIGGTFNTTYNTEMVPGAKVASVYVPLDIRQMTGTLNLKQRIYDTKLTFDLGKTTYDREIPRLSNRINPNSTRLQGLSGLLQGFPDLEWKVGAYEDVGDYITFWTTYDHIRLIVATQANHGDSDSYMIGMDAFSNTWISGTLQYNYLTQTGQPQSDLYGASVSLKFP